MIMVLSNGISSEKKNVSTLVLKRIYILEIKVVASLNPAHMKVITILL